MTILSKTDTGTSRKSFFNKGKPSLILIISRRLVVLVRFEYDLLFDLKLSHRKNNQGLYVVYGNQDKYNYIALIVKFQMSNFIIINTFYF